MGEVQARIPRENLLVFNVKDGWRPLCDFLLANTTCPANAGEPFPKVNEQATIAMMLNFCKVVVLAWPVLLVVILGSALRAASFLLSWRVGMDASERKTK